MAGTILEQSKPTSKLLQRLLSRDVALWIGSAFEAGADSIDSLAGLAALPWSLVLVEPASEELARAIQDRANSRADYLRLRGYAHVIAQDPSELSLPPRSLPIYLLNGRSSGVGPESATLGARASQRRRLNQLARLATSRPTEVLLVAFTAEQLEDLKAIWTEDLRSLVSVVSTEGSLRSSIESWLQESPSPAAIDLYSLDTRSFLEKIDAELRRTYAPERLTIRIRTGDEFRELDITDCELIEQPLLDRYEILQARDLVPLQPEELRFEDLADFFHRTASSWRPYAAGVPWRRNEAPYKVIRSALAQAEREGPGANRLHVIASQPGAGGTTLARDIAHSVGMEGFPALVARPSLFRPTLTEVESFLLRVQRTSEAESLPESPWLVVFDTAHWEGREHELSAFVTQLSRRGRPVVVLAVVSDRMSEQLETILPDGPLVTLRHDIDRDDAVRLGAHLNRFLAPHARTKTPTQWLAFWEEHRPDIDSPIAAFWIALEFWLKGLLDLGQSIQQWIYQQFSALQITDEVRVLLLQVAALTVERRPMPEGLMPMAPDMERPFGVILDDIRSTAPAIGLVEDNSEYHSRWALAHTQLGRYLLSSAYFDRKLCDRLGLAAARNPTHLRLMLLAQIAHRPEISQSAFRDLALDFAVRVFKLDPGHAVEFFPLWRDVFGVLDGVPSQLRNTSRTFLHHIAISCRRVATSANYFPDATPSEREQLLRAAVKHIEFALQLPRTDDDERDLNLYNSLALAFQNLAEARRLAAAPESEIAELRDRATDATLRAQQEDPLNPYVLETSAKNLLQSAALDPRRRAADASLALGFIYEAITRNRASARVGQLSQLLRRAVDLLKSESASGAIDKLRASGASLGFVAAAWIALTGEEGDALEVSAERAAAALAILDEASGQHEWPWLKLRFDLLAVARPYDFDEQLSTLEELDGTAFRMPFQYQLEHAILLHQIGRHLDGRKLFRALRRDLREHDAYVEVPARMRWLLSPDRTAKLVCEARVQDAAGFKHRARVRDLGGEDVPFTPQDFGQRRISPGQHLKVTINFGAMGPYAKPPGGGSAT